MRRNQKFSLPCCFSAEDGRNRLRESMKQTKLRSIKDEKFELKSCRLATFLVQLFVVFQFPAALPTNSSE